MSSRTKPIFYTCLFSLLCACGSTHSPGDSMYKKSVAPGTRLPADSLETSILEQLEDLGPNNNISIEGNHVQASQPYSAASGRICRTILITGPRSAQKLICKMDQKWAYVPDVMGYEK